MRQSSLCHAWLVEGVRRWAQSANGYLSHFLNTERKKLVVSSALPNMDAARDVNEKECESERPALEDICTRALVSDGVPELPLAPHLIREAGPGITMPLRHLNHV